MVCDSWSLSLCILVFNFGIVRNRRAAWLLLISSSYSSLHVRVWLYCSDEQSLNPVIVSYLIKVANEWWNFAYFVHFLVGMMWGCEIIHWRSVLVSSIVGVFHTFWITRFIKNLFILTCGLCRRWFFACNNFNCSSSASIIFLCPSFNCSLCWMDAFVNATCTAASTLELEVLPVIVNKTFGLFP